MILLSLPTVTMPSSPTADNMDILTDTAPQTYNDMCTIWESLGETVDRDAVNTIFDTTYLEALADKYKSNTAVTNKVEVTQEQKTAAVDYSSMLTKSCTVNFVPDTAKFLDQASSLYLHMNLLKSPRLWTALLSRLRATSTRSARKAKTASSSPTSALRPWPTT